MANKNNKISSDCFYCNNSFSYEIPGQGTLIAKTEEPKPYLIECDVCHKKMVDVYCPKCGMGGLTVPEASDFSMGKIDDLSKRPTNWQCNNCKNSWPIPPETYDIDPILVGSDLKPEAIEKIKKTISEKGLTINKRGPKLWFLFLVNFVVTAIDQTFGQIVFMLLIFSAFFGFLNKKTLFRVVLASVLGVFLGLLVPFGLTIK